MRTYSIIVSILMLSIIFLVNCKWTLQEVSLECFPPNQWECGCNLVDERDGKSYRTIKIDTACWMAENLEFGDLVTSYDSAAMKTDGLTQYLSNGLYPKDELENLESSPKNPCPPGWRLPSLDEIKHLRNLLKVSFYHRSFNPRGSASGIQHKHTGEKMFENENTFFWSDLVKEQSACMDTTTWTNLCKAANGSTEEIQYGVMLVNSKDLWYCNCPVIVNDYALSCRCVYDQ